ncbi:hypothetical protein [Massilia sp. PAMC28688]|uniref:hypothetical protein n=1 Tax=Massilia sp. PAMC28688 TaxID=2861283 RepID=UPI001E627537|nr:hypothetical protein [Massilia sp. PAMC28688]
MFETKQLNLTSKTRAAVMRLQRARGDHRKPEWVVEDAFQAWIEKIAREDTDVAQAETRGYQWKSLFLPEGTRVRFQYKRETYYADVRGDALVYNGRAYSPRQLLLHVTGTVRNAWRELWLRSPGDFRWHLADTRRLILRRVPTGRHPRGVDVASHNDMNHYRLQAQRERAPVARNDEPIPCDGPVAQAVGAAESAAVAADEGGGTVGKGEPLASEIVEDCANGKQVAKAPGVENLDEECNAGLSSGLNSRLDPRLDSRPDFRPDFRPDAQPDARPDLGADLRGDSLHSLRPRDPRDDQADAALCENRHGLIEEELDPAKYFLMVFNQADSPSAAPTSAAGSSPGTPALAGRNNHLGHGRNSSSTEPVPRPEERIRPASSPALDTAASPCSDPDDSGSCVAPFPPGLPIGNPPYRYPGAVHGASLRAILYRDDVVRDDQPDLSCGSGGGGRARAGRSGPRDRRWTGHLTQHSAGLESPHRNR